MTNPKFKNGQKVKYWGSYLDQFGNMFSVEGDPQYRPDYSPPGYYYDLTSHDLKQIPESELTQVK